MRRIPAKAIDNRFLNLFGLQVFRYLSSKFRLTIRRRLFCNNRSSIPEIRLRQDGIAFVDLPDSIDKHHLHEQFIYLKSLVDDFDFYLVQFLSSVLS